MATFDTRVAKVRHLPGSAAKDLAAYFEANTKDAHGEIPFQSCETFEVVGIVGNSEGTLFKKVVKIEQSCPKPTAIRIELPKPHSSVAPQPHSPKPRRMVGRKPVTTMTPSPGAASRRGGSLPVCARWLHATYPRPETSMVSKWHAMNMK